jgi:hypothetical protein
VQRRNHLTAALAVIVLCAIGAACGDHSQASTPPTADPTATTPAPPTSAPPTPPAVVDVQAMDDMFMGPATATAGPTTISLHNGGAAAHQLQLLRLHPGVTADEALAAANSPNPSALLTLVTPAGGPNAVAPGAAQAVTVDLVPGTYVEVCFITDADGVPHLAKGMISVLDVTGPARPFPTPDTVGRVTLHDFRFDLPNPLHREGTLEVTNDGPQPHEMTIVALGTHTVAEAISYLSATTHSGPPPFTPAGGIGALAPGQTGFVDLHLPAGRYLAICEVPDPKTGKPHVVLGMATPFTVE